MTQFTDLLNHIIETESYDQKARILSVIVKSIESKKGNIPHGEKEEIVAFAFTEIKKLISAIPQANTYRQKDEMFSYEDNLMGIVILCHPSAAQVPEENLNDIKTLVKIVNKERFIERAVDDIFERGNKEKESVERLLCALIPLKDEYQKAQLYNGLLHYQHLIPSLPDDSKKLFADYINGQLKFYLSTELTEEMCTSLEMLSDVAQHFATDEILTNLKALLKIEKSSIRYYTVRSLLATKQEIPQEIIVSLANDIVYADMTYAILKMHGKTNLFPQELANEEYLAKSDLVHWLTFPTELGKVPDKIEYLGKVKKKEIYHIFRYTSDSDNLSEDLQGKWLIGWSNNEGGTFSNFDLYSNFEQKTVEKTLKVIKRKLL
jgi:hypothetical protein